MNSIRPCRSDDLERMFQIINDAAQAYRGVIPPDRWKEPYMPREELEHEIDLGVRFSGIEAHGVLVGIMGVQPVKNVTLIRHAYVATEHRSKGWEACCSTICSRRRKDQSWWAPGRSCPQCRRLAKAKSHA